MIAPIERIAAKSFHERHVLHGSHPFNDMSAVGHLLEGNTYGGQTPDFCVSYIIITINMKAQYP
jgi:hypothetical protein